MSTGKIKKPRNPDLPSNLFQKPLDETIYHVVQTCEVDVNDDEIYNKIEKTKSDLNDTLSKLVLKLEKGSSDLSNELKQIKKLLGSNQGNLTKDIQSIRAEVEQLKERKPLELIIRTNSQKPVDLGTQHDQLPTLIEILSTGLNVYLVGPSGSGKTHAAAQCAKALDVPFHFTGAVASEFKLTGFIDAKGQIVSTEFRKAYESGGVFLFDEIDASYPQAVLAFNAALANDFMDFPDKRVNRHKDFYCIAAANTIGQGADRQYVGRNQLDAASLDRFVFLEWNYDENLERSLAGNNSWTNYVQNARKAIFENKIRHVVSPRASIFGAKLIAKGMDKEKVSDLVLWKGLSLQDVNKIKVEMKPRKQLKASESGTFVPSLSVGDIVEKGDKIGFIGKGSNYYGGFSTEKIINSTFSGTITRIEKKTEVVKGQFIAEIRLS